ncbi:hypothetical protein FQA39_LY10478 [Lamprigera yunnana]|nr:hypothetical protein FQA39_LY10478 [Lamprigera yunnana]
MNSAEAFVIFPYNPEHKVLGKNLVKHKFKSHPVLYKKDLDASYKIKLDAQDALGYLKFDIVKVFWACDSDRLSLVFKAWMLKLNCSPSNQHYATLFLRKWKFEEKRLEKLHLKIFCSRLKYSTFLINYSSKHKQLLLDLKCTTESLLVAQVANVWSIYGGLNRVHNCIEKIFKNGCKAISNGNTSDYWKFIHGLEWLQPKNVKFSLVVDSEYKSHIPLHLKLDKASVWLYRSLENHSLSQKLSWLLSDKKHLESCYQSQAFLYQEKYAESVLICLRSVERSQPSLISEIDPCLFLNKVDEQKYHKIHRRCSSFPENNFKSMQELKTHNKISLQLDQNLKILQTKLPGKLKPWNSMPNLALDPNVDIVKRSKSHTTPSTPVISRYNTKRCLKPHFSLLKTNIKKIRSSNNIKKRVKHVMINNCDVVEHTPSSHSHASALAEVNSLVKSLPTTKSYHYLVNTPSSIPEYGFLSALSGQKDYRRQPKKTFIEDGGMSVLPMATGYFPRPIKGQTLTAFLTSSQIVRSHAELDRENAHFSVSEAVISAMEQIRCKRDLKLADEHVDESDEEIMNLKQRIRMRRQQKVEEKESKMRDPFLSGGKADTTTTIEVSYSPLSTSSERFHSSSSEEVDDVEIDEASNLEKHRGISMSMASLYSEADLFKKPRGAPDGASDVLSAEGVALSLISRFNEKQLPRASDLEWLVSEEDAPQALLPLPKSWPISPDECDENSTTPLRGTKEWAPPRPQIIFTPHPRPERKHLMEKQNYRCAGCGMRVAPQYASRFRYCNYLGRYFCTGCHTNQLALIPGRVLQKWDFTRYSVSNFSYRLLEQMYVDPLFRIFELNKNISKKSKNLMNSKKYRLGLHYMKDFIMTCRFAETVQEYLEKENSYIYNDPDIYSMFDLVNVRSGEMINGLKYLVELCCRHTSECELELLYVKCVTQTKSYSPGNYVR